MARTKSTEVYEVSIPHARVVYVEAQGKQEAKSIAVHGITVTKLSGREVRDLVSAGKTIIDGTEAAPEPFGKGFITAADLADEPAGDA